MSTYLKLFNNHQSYDDFTKTSDFVKPNVSHCISENEVHYNPYIPPFFCKLTLDDGSVVELEGSGQLVESMVNPYKETLVGAEIGELCTSITNSAFTNCSGLTSVTVGNNVTTINNSAFQGCSSLTEVTIPSSVTTINNSAFQGCSSLSSIGGKDSNASVKMECINTYIGESAFQYCSGLTTVSLPNGVTTITNAAFYQCINLTNVTIPSSVTSIGRQAFRVCRGLTSVTIPSSVTSIDEFAFGGCLSLTSITVEATTPPTLTNGPFYDTNDCPIYVPSASVDTYKAASGWSIYASRIQAIPTT